MAVVNGGDGNDSLRGTSGADTINGLGGDDWLRGGAGSDLLNGGDGSDWGDYRTATSGVTVSLAVAGAQATGGAGTDTLVSIENLAGGRFADALTGSSELRFEAFAGGAGNDTIDGGAITDRATFTNSNQAEYTTAAAAVAVNLGTGTATGGAGNDTLININMVAGSAFADTLTGSDNTLFEQFMGLAGNDVIDGGSLAAGTARVAYNLSPSAVVVDLAAGTAQDGHGTVDTLTNINAVRASSFDDTLRGSNSTAGLEYFEGRTGDDLIDGRGGRDMARYDWATGAVSVNLATGLATGADGSDVLLNIEYARGSNFDDTLIGDDGNNGLEGRIGADSLDGGAGNDTLNGASGNDTLVGGAAATADIVDYSASTGVVRVNLTAGTGGSVSEGADVLVGIEGVIGGRFGDVLVGSSAANVLRGGGGNDVLRGRGGADRLDGGTGADWADYRDATSAVSVSLATNASSGGGGADTLVSIENLRGSTTYADRLVGNARANVLEGLGGDDTLSGGSGNDVLRGAAGADRLTGGSGNDRLDGGLGSDVLVGGTGRDVYVVNAATDRTVETSTLATEIDTVSATLDWTLAANVENLVLSGSAAIDGTGNGLANRISGNAGANVLRGGGGNDTLAGGLGSDVLIGSTGNDVLSGQSGNDLLRGGAGADRLGGGAGADTFRFDTAATTADRLTDFSAVADRLQFENAVFTALGPVGALAASAFRAGTAAADANDRIVYDAATGRLWYDADGNGSGAALLVANLGANTALTVADLFVV